MKYEYKWINPTSYPIYDEVTTKNIFGKEIKNKVLIKTNFGYDFEKEIPGGKWKFVTMDGKSMLFVKETK